MLVEKQEWYYLTHSWMDKRVHAFSDGICPKVNIIVGLEFALAYFKAAIHRINHYAIGMTPEFSFKKKYFVPSFLSLFFFQTNMQNKPLSI